MITHLHILLEGLAGSIIGFFIGLSGIGGGVLILPTLLLFQLPPSIAVGTSSLFALITKAYALIEYIKLNTIHYRTSMYFLMGAVPGSVLASTGINLYMHYYRGSPRAIAVLQRGLKYVMVSALLLSVLLLLIQIRKRIDPGVLPSSFKAGRKILGMTSGFVVGALVGATSIGAGVLIIPVLILFFGLSTAQSVGSSIFIAVVLVLCTSVIYGTGGQIAYVTAMVMSVCAFAGVYVGSRVSVHVRDARLKLFVTCLVFIAALVVVFTGVV
jgi:hypothetical protein